GNRIKLSHTRAMITAALEGKLDHVETEADPVFGLAIPKAVPGVPAEMLTPRNTWADKAAYDAKAKYLASLFVKNFDKYAAGASAETLAAAPKL
ncbi:MAG TPA: phosphoenolpyruvate carboxykinase (ATP), partial [Flavisolibacter sp.]|nr:phosphoenolpyruvate carboxykinase (ATP) [Flavisolibacter sp.]